MARAVRPRSPRLNPLRPFARCIVGVERRPRPGGGGIDAFADQQRWRTGAAGDGELERALRGERAAPSSSASDRARRVAGRELQQRGLSCPPRVRLSKAVSHPRQFIAVERRQLQPLAFRSLKSTILPHRSAWALPSKAAQQIRVVIGPWANGGLAPESSPAWLADQRSQSVGLGGQKDPV